MTRLLTNDNFRQAPAGQEQSQNKEGFANISKPKYSIKEGTTTTQTDSYGNIKVICKNTNTNASPLKKTYTNQQRIQERYPSITSFDPTLSLGGGSMKEYGTFGGCSSF